MRCLLFFIMLAISIPAVGFADDGSSLGEQLYNQGLVSTGEPLQGVAEGDIQFKDAHFNCAQCHRPSGYGSSEGGNYVLPITAASLFNPRSFDRNDIFQKLFKESQSKLFRAKMRSPSPRPAYTDESLARAIREGVDPTGKALSALMPRYQISDQDMSALVAYLKNLSSDNDPGVDADSIYFATIVGKGVNADDKNAMLSTISKYVDWMNWETRGNQKHPNFSPNFRSDLAKGFRIWKHEIWELSDNPDKWPEELAAYYRKQPVFALIGGMADGDWLPIHEFCEKNKIPDLFPITSLPPAGQANHYSVYFNEGLALEAKVAAKFLQQDNVQPILQIYVDEAEGRIPAKIFSQTLNSSSNGTIEDFPVRSIDDFRSYWRQYVKDHPHIGTVVLWPGKQTVALLAELDGDIKKIDRLFLPSAALQEDWKHVAKQTKAKITFSYPYELPDVANPHAFRIRAWMNTRKLEITKPAIQFNTYYALNMLQYGLEPIVDHFSRNYMLEYIEHEAESALNPGTFPRLSLGPEQRFASKGAYLVQMDAAGKQPVKAVSPWIVP